ncbi:unnamed protein product, partial [Closterium sp. Naga37s-1]
PSVTHLPPPGTTPPSPPPAKLYTPCPCSLCCPATYPSLPPRFPDTTPPVLPPAKVYNPCPCSLCCAVPNPPPPFLGTRPPLPPPANLYTPCSCPLCLPAPFPKPPSFPLLQYPPYFLPPGARPSAIITFHRSPNPLCPLFSSPPFYFAFTTAPLFGALSAFPRDGGGNRTGSSPPTNAVTQTSLPPPQTQRPNGSITPALRSPPTNSLFGPLPHEGPHWAAIAPPAQPTRPAPTEGDAKGTGRPKGEVEEVVMTLSGGDRTGDLMLIDRPLAHYLTLTDEDDGDPSVPHGEVSPTPPLPNPMLAGGPREEPEETTRTRLSEGAPIHLYPSAHPPPGTSPPRPPPRQALSCDRRGSQGQGFLRGALLPDPGHPAPTSPPTRSPPSHSGTHLRGVGSNLLLPLHALHTSDPPPLPSLPPSCPKQLVPAVTPSHNVALLHLWLLTSAPLPTPAGMDNQNQVGCRRKKRGKGGKGSAHLLPPPSLPPQAPLLTSHPFEPAPGLTPMGQPPHTPPPIPAPPQGHGSDPAHSPSGCPSSPLNSPQVAAAACVIVVGADERRDAPMADATDSSSHTSHPVRVGGPFPQPMDSWESQGGSREQGPYPSSAQPARPTPPPTLPALPPLPAGRQVTETPQEVRAAISDLLAIQSPSSPPDAPTLPVPQVRTRTYAEVAHSVPSFTPPTTQLGSSLPCPMESDLVLRPCHSHPDVVAPPPVQPVTDALPVAQEGTGTGLEVSAPADTSLPGVAEPPRGPHPAEGEEHTTACSFGSPPNPPSRTTRPVRPGDPTPSSVAPSPPPPTPLLHEVGESSPTLLPGDPLGAQADHGVPSTASFDTTSPIDPTDTATSPDQVVRCPTCKSSLANRCALQHHTPFCHPADAARRAQAVHDTTSILPSHSQPRATGIQFTDAQWQTLDSVDWTEYFSQAAGPTFLLAAAPTLFLAPATPPDRSHTAAIAKRISCFGRGEWDELLSDALGRCTPLPRRTGHRSRNATNPSTADERRIARCLRLAVCNETSRASAALESAEAAPGTAGGGRGDTGWGTAGAEGRGGTAGEGGQQRQQQESQRRPRAQGATPPGLGSGVGQGREQQRADGGTGGAAGSGGEDHGVREAAGDRAERLGGLGEGREGEGRGQVGGGEERGRETTGEEAPRDQTGQQPTQQQGPVGRTGRVGTSSSRIPDLTCRDVGQTLMVLVDAQCIIRHAVRQLGGSDDGWMPAPVPLSAGQGTWHHITGHIPCPLMPSAPPAPNLRMPAPSPPPLTLPAPLAVSHRPPFVPPRPCPPLVYLLLPPPLLHCTLLPSPHQPTPLPAPPQSAPCPSFLGPLRLVSPLPAPRCLSPLPSSPLSPLPHSPPLVLGFPPPCPMFPPSVCSASPLPASPSSRPAPHFPLPHARFLPSLHLPFFLHASPLFPPCPWPPMPLSLVSPLPAPRFFPP